MNAHKLIPECERLASSLTPYLDGELDPGHIVDLETHASSCGACAESIAVARATRASLRRVAGRTMTCSATLRDRVSAAIAAERSAPRPAPAITMPITAASLGSDGDDGGSPTLIRLRYAVALAAAAGIALAFGAARSRTASTAQSEVEAQPPHQEASVARFDNLLDELVALHAKPLPPETTNPEELPRFDPFVGVPVRRPAFKPFGANFNGARVVPAMLDRRAALLQYTVSGHRVTVYVFDPRAVPLRPIRLHARVMHEPLVTSTEQVSRRLTPVYSGKLRGYSVAAAESARGVGYAIASDLDDDESAKMVMAAAVP
jgi:anti-sigma factor RsiW